MKVVILLFSLAILSITSALTYSISGLSSGGFMTTQMHVAYSSVINGAAIIAGGPYYCTMGSLVRASSACTTNPWLIDIDIQVSQATISSQDGLIDPLSGLSTDKVYIFSGSSDQRVLPGVVMQTEAFYRRVMPNGSINTTYNIPANHAWITVNEGNPCWVLGPPYINACGYDLSESVLFNLYGPLTPKAAFNNSNLFQFEQSDYADVWKAGMGTRGWIYANYYCRQNPILCRLHVTFHGCDQSYSTLGDVYVKGIGMGEWAETNNIVVIFPQTAIQNLVNPEGCWDFWGYTGSNYYLKSALQMTAVNAMAQDYMNIIQNLD